MQSSILVPNNLLSSIEDRLLSFAASDFCNASCFYLFFKHNENTCCYHFESGTFDGFLLSNCSKLEEIFSCAITVPILFYNKDDISMEKKETLIFIKIQEQRVSFLFFKDYYSCWSLCLLWFFFTSITYLITCIILYFITKLWLDLHWLTGQYL